MKLIDGTVVEHRNRGPDYRELVFLVPEIASEANPGQFIHLKVPRLSNAALRRPFSIYKVSGDGLLSIIYKRVGRGTEALGYVFKDERVSLLGPLGNGFPMPATETFPALAGGGYGIAPLVFLAKRSGRCGSAFIGAATADDVLCSKELEAMGWEVRVATEDGSNGRKGLVTDVFDEWAGSLPERSVPEIYACGPDGMLKAMGSRACNNGWKAWLSLDRHMGCGLGACLACVQKIRLSDGSEVLRRVCKDGPVFEAGEVVWD
ncbi:MAG: dihydroorotate dehydrogenase electron transfer subunit [Verrucomicrobiota bacterium]